MPNSWLNSLLWPWDPASQLSKLWESTHSDACSPQDSKTPGTSLEPFTTQLLSSVIKELFNPTWTSTIHTSALAPKMPTTFLNFLETTMQANKPFSATALKLQATPSHEQYDIHNKFKTLFSLHNFLPKTHKYLKDKKFCLKIYKFVFSCFKLKKVLKTQSFYTR